MRLIILARKRHACRVCMGKMNQNELEVVTSKKRLHVYVHIYMTLIAVKKKFYLESVNKILKLNIIVNLS